jgi:hypothetical protein
MTVRQQQELNKFAKEHIPDASVIISYLEVIVQLAGC